MPWQGGAQEHHPYGSDDDDDEAEAVALYEDLLERAARADLGGLKRRPYRLARLTSDHGHLP